MSNTITQAYLKSILHYDPDTGVFAWRKRNDVNHKSWNTRFAGKTAGTMMNNGYLKISIKQTGYLAHRLAWLYMVGYWPPNFIDHINQIKHDNRFNNLREATNQQNQANSIKRINTKVVLKGVSTSHHGKYRAQIGVDGKIKFLGYFDTPEEAHTAYITAARKAFGEFARSE